MPKAYISSILCRAEDQEHPLLEGSEEPPSVAASTPSSPPPAKEPQEPPEEVSPDPGDATTPPVIPEGAPEEASLTTPRIVNEEGPLLPLESKVRERSYIT